VDRLQELVEYIVRGLVDHPEEVAVTAVETDGMTVYEVSVADEDLGKVIGREGRTANALRQLIKAAAMKVERKAIVEILS